jgi:hypothetical protein
MLRLPSRRRAMHLSKGIVYRGEGDVQNKAHADMRRACAVYHLICRIYQVRHGNVSAAP